MKFLYRTSLDFGKTLFYKVVGNLIWRKVTQTIFILGTQDDRNVMMPISAWTEPRPPRAWSCHWNHRAQNRKPTASLGAEWKTLQLCRTKFSQNPNLAYKKFHRTPSVKSKTMFWGFKSNGIGTRKFPEIGTGHVHLFWVVS